MEFQHVRLDDRPPCGRLGFCLTPDLTGNGLPDVLVGGMGQAGQIDLLGKRIKLRKLPVAKSLFEWRESNVFWYENPGWERHDVVSTPDLSVGGSVGDIDGDGQVELVVGQNNGSDLYWFDPPPNPRESWDRYLITDEFEKYHDTAIADVDGDGDEEVIILSQNSEIVCFYDIPDTPTQTPWPPSSRQVIARDLLAEGLAVGDIDGNGRPELIAGPNVFSQNGANGSWTRRTIAGEWLWTRVAIGDLDDDGLQEIVMTEGDLPYHGDRKGRLGLVEPESLSVSVIDDGLSNPHTVQIADVNGDGTPDILVAEMGAEGDEARVILYENHGENVFEPTVLSRGISTHEAKVTDLTGDGRLDIVGKSYGPPAHVDAWLRVD